MIHCPDPKAISIRMNKFPLPKQRPHVSKQPWAGFTGHDCPRGIPLPVCPSPRCRRAKACVAAHEGLYCQRTHFSPPEQRKWKRRDPHERAITAIPPAQADSAVSHRLKLLIERAAIRVTQGEAMKARWIAGEFDHLYGPYTHKGVLMKAPPKIYVERPERDGA
jgi:hypothetical protein